MRPLFACVGLLGALLVLPANASVIYNNLTPNNLIGLASRPATPGPLEIEAADDFALGSQTFINSATFVGLIVPNAANPASISSVVGEIYRVFPQDSDTTRTISVPSRANSPSDVAFDTRDSAAGELTFTSSVLSSSFTVLNSVQAGGIHPAPGNITGGNGALTGQEVQITVNFLTPFDLPANHYFFIPQVGVTGGQFYWLSASRPVSGAGTTSFPAGVTDLQAWIRDANLDPDWLRVGTDIVGGGPAPTFNMAFSLDGTVAPEPSTMALMLSAIAMVGLRLRKLR